MVWKVDRLGRSTLESLSTAKDLNERGVHIVITTLCRIFAGGGLRAPCLRPSLVDLLRVAQFTMLAVAAVFSRREPSFRRTPSPALFRCSRSSRDGVLVLQHPADELQGGVEVVSLGRHQRLCQ